MIEPLTSAQIDAIRQSLGSGDHYRTHWKGCETDRKHRDCAIRLLLAELDRRDTALRALVEQWRARVDQIVFEDGKHVHERCEGFIDCADQLAALLPTTGDQP